MNILQIDHLGIAVNSLEEGQAFWCDIMGLKMAGTETVAEQKVTTAFCPVGEAEVELLVSDRLSKFPAPTEEEIRLIREEIDPTGVFVKSA